MSKLKVRKRSGYLSGVGGAPLGRRNEEPHVPVRLWAIVMAVLTIGIVLAWWLPWRVFTRPEQPAHYAFLQRIGKLETPKPFKTEPPIGRSISIADLIADLSGLNDEESREHALGNLRAYLRNYKRSSPVKYLKGDFTIASARPLGPGDFIGEGVLLTLQSDSVPSHTGLHLILPEAKYDPVLAPIDTPISITRSGSRTVELFSTHDPATSRTEVFLIPLAYPRLRAGEHYFECAPPARVQLPCQWHVDSVERGSNPL